MIACAAKHIHEFKFQKPFERIKKTKKIHALYTTHQTIENSLSRISQQINTFSFREI